MNKTMQNRIGGVPTAHNGNTKTRFFRKPIAALLMLLVMLGAGGKVWGVTINWSGSVSATNYPTWTLGATVTTATNINGYIVLPANSTINITGNVTLNSPLLCWDAFGCGNITIVNNTNNTYTITDNATLNASKYYMFNAGLNGNNDATLTIKGNNGNNGGKIILDGNQSGFSSEKTSGINIYGPNSKCIMYDVTMQNFYASVGACVLINNGNLECHDCVFHHNKATNGGAILYNVCSSKSSLTDCTFTSNVASAAGGAIFVSQTADGMTLNCTNVTFGDSNDATKRNTSSTWGGAIFSWAELSLDGCEFYYNKTTASSNSDAGAIWCANDFTTKNNCVFSYNESQAAGGAMMLYGTLNGVTFNLDITNTTFIGNKSVGNGGAIYLQSGGALHCSAVTFGDSNDSPANPTKNNTSIGHGGAIYSTGKLTIDNTTGSNYFYYNTSTGGNGGAIRINNNFAGSNRNSISHATFVGNKASTSGGAIFINGGGDLLCSSVTFTSNQTTNAATSDINGGAIYQQNGTLSCTSVTFGDSSDNTKGNKAGCSGGAIFANGTLIINGTSGFYYNQAGINGDSSTATLHCSGGAIFNNSGSLTCTGTMSGNVKSITFKGNRAIDGGAITNYNASSSSLTHCAFRSNVATRNGGSIIHDNTSQLSASNCLFDSNSASSSTEGGGAIFTVSSASTSPCLLDSCTFKSNTAFRGGAVFARNAITVRNCKCYSNTAVSSSAANSYGGFLFYGGGVSNTAGYVEGGSLYSNSASNSNTAANAYGGAIYAEKESGNALCNLTIRAYNGNSPLIYSNTAPNGGGVCAGSNSNITMSSGNIGTSGNPNTANKGGGVYVAGGTFNLSGGNVQYNTTSGSNKEGAGIYLASGSVSMTGGKVNNNTGATSGGGVYVASGTFGLSSSGEIISNSAGAGGGVYQAGGTFNQSGGYIGKSSYSNTTTSQGGCGVYLNSGTFNLSSGYISYNSGTGFGGGVRLEGGTLAMSGGQIVNNTSNSNGGGVYKNAGTLRVTGAPVIKDNRTGTNANDVYFGTVTATPKYMFIGAAGLQCGAEIGVYKSITGDNKIVEAEGGDRAANANYAMRNGFFFDDRGSSNIGSSTSSPYYNVSSYELYFVNGTAPAWSQTTQPSGYTVSGGSTITISSAQGLAYMAHQVNSGADTYSGKTVLLSADINLSGNKWVPIGYMTECDRDPLNPEGFKGTFDGQGHTIYNMDCDHPFYDNAGLFGIVRGGTVKNLMVSGTITNASANLGGIVGEMIGGTVYNCMATVTPSGGSNRGALVGKITSGSVKNCYAISNAAAAGNGTVTNCYVRKASGGTAANMGNATNVGSSGSTSGAFTQTVTPYLYKHADNRVGSTSLLTLLNQWVDGQSSPADLAHWSRTMASPINGDYPILMYDNLSMTCVGTKSATPELLKYGTSLNTMLGNQYNGNGDNIYFWGTESGITYSQRNGNIYFSEDAAIIHTGSSIIEHAHVGITVDNTNGSAGVHWHMFSPALKDAPLGINYNNDNTDWPFSLGHPSGMPYYLFNPKSESSTIYGYFPSHEYGTNYPNSNASATSYYPDWDYYCYYEPEYHWINFKRNGNSHHHEDLDPSHPHINYKATPSAAANENESTLIKGKGYLVATAQPTLLEAKGTLNQGTFTIAVTKDSPTYRTGFNFLGNPYLSYFDFNAFATANSGSGKIWSSTANASYYLLDKDGYHSYVFSASNNQLTAPRCLHAHQGFMVVTENACNATFTNAMRLTDGTAPFRDEHIDYPLVNLIATGDDGNRDITTIELGRPEVGGAFKYYDLHLGKGCLYTHYEDQDYAIAFTLPGIDQVGVRFETDEDATYTMTWDMENGEFSYLHLIDNITGSDIDCLQAREYRFSSKTTDFKSRFKLVFGYTGVEEQEDGPSTGSGTFAFIMGNELVVNCGPSTPSTGSGAATLQMFDMTGRQVMSTTVSGTQTTTMLPNVTAGVYVLRLSDRTNGTRTQKIVIE